MNWKTTVALAVIVVAGGLYIQFVEQKGETTESINEKGKKVFASKDLSDHVSRIAINKSDVQYVFERLGDSTDALWKMTEPLKARADKSEAKGIASALEDLTIKNSISKVDALSNYGLDKPRATITFTADGKESSLLIGEASPTDKNEVFVKRKDRDAVYQVSDSIFDKVNKSQNEFRDKTVAHLTKDGVSGLQFDWKDKPDVHATKDKGDWTLSQPVEDYAKKSKFETFIDKIKDLKIDKDDFYTESVDDASKYGLDVPVLKVTIKGGGKKGDVPENGSYVILFGKSVEGDADKIYARRADEPTVFGVDKKILDDLKTEDLKDIRSDDFAVFDDDNVNKIQIKLASGEVIVEKTEKKKDEEDESSSSETVWKVTKPKEMEADKSTVDDFIDHLDGAKIEEFVNDDPKKADLVKRGLSNPVATITVTLKDGGGSKSYEIGKADLSDKAKFYARRSGSKNIFLVKKEDFHRDASSGYLLFKEKQVIDFNKSDARKLVVSHAGKTVVLKKTTSDWQLALPVTAPASQSNVDNVLWGINSLDAVRFVAEAPKDLAKFGLDKPIVKVTVEVEEAPKTEGKEDKEKKSAAKVNRTITLLVGKKISDDDGYFAKVGEGDNETFVFTISKYKFETLTKELHELEVIDITKSDVESLTLQYKKVTITCKKDEKDSEKWAITSPKKTEGKKSAIEDILDELDPLKADKIAAYKAGSSELAKFGLNSPELILKLSLTGNKEKKIRIGSATKIDSTEYLHVKADAKDAVFLVRKSKVDDLKKTLKDLVKQEEKKNDTKKADAAGKPGSDAGK